MFTQIYDNLISGGAWQAILSGLGVTVLISLAGVFLGTVVGAVLCAMGRSRSRWLRRAAMGYTVLVRGTPVLMLLMLLYYVILAPLRTGAMLTAFVAFGLNGGAHIGELMNTALDCVDPGQIQAARTLGFTKTGAFFAVTLPQAAQVAKPVFQNAVVNMIQWTSVVGYISIADLTRVVNNFGSRTVQPFFALALGIFIYLLLAYLVNALFRLGDKRRNVR